MHAHLYICASVDMRVGPSLQTLLTSHINQALASSTGLQGQQLVSYARVVFILPVLVLKGIVSVCTATHKLLSLSFTLQIRLIS